MRLKELLAAYLFPGKTDKVPANTRMIAVMHMINKASLMLFVICLLVMLARLLTSILLSA